MKCGVAPVNIFLKSVVIESWVNKHHNGGKATTCIDSTESQNNSNSCLFTTKNSTVNLIILCPLFVVEDAKMFESYNNSSL